MDPTPLVFRKGAYVPWGPVQKLQYYGWRLTQVWLVYMAAIAISFVYVKLVSPML